MTDTSAIREPVQCDGCPAGVLVWPGRPGHLDTCDLCQKHCTCFVPAEHTDLGEEAA